MQIVLLDAYLQNDKRVHVPVKLIRAELKHLEHLPVEMSKEAIQFKMLLLHCLVDVAKSNINQ